MGMTMESIFEVDVKLTFTRLNDEQEYVINIPPLFEYYKEDGSIEFIPGSEVPLDDDNLTYQDIYIPHMPDIAYEVEKLFTDSERRPNDGKSKDVLLETLRINKIKLEAFLHKPTPFVVHETIIDPNKDIADQLNDIGCIFEDIMNTRFYELLEEEYNK
jgi:hypothetical protein